MHEFTFHQKALLFALVAIGLIGAGLGLRKAAPPPGSGDVVQIVDEGSDHGKREAEKPIGVVMVHVSGKVRKPGVYRLPPDSRVIHAIRAAGGCLPNADVDCLNLAREAKDGEQIYVPSKEQTRLAANGQPGRPIVVKPPTARPPSATRGVKIPAVRIDGSSSVEKLRNSGEGTVNINTADESELQRLPGVGPVTAQRIFEFRQQNGSLTSAEQLMDVKGIGPKKFERMAPFVTL